MKVHLNGITAFLPKRCLVAFDTPDKGIAYKGGFEGINMEEGVAFGISNLMLTKGCLTKNPQRLKSHFSCVESVDEVWAFASECAVTVGNIPFESKIIDYRSGIVHLRFATGPRMVFSLKLLRHSMSIPWRNEVNQSVNSTGFFICYNSNMLKPSKKPETISEYISNFPAEHQTKLNEIYEIIKKSCPGATEAIKWSNPSFSYKRIIVIFGGFQHHIGFYPTPSPLVTFKEELSKFESAKGSVKFPYDKPLPNALITKIVKFRVKELKKEDAKWKEK